MERRAFKLEACELAFVDTLDRHLKLQQHLGSAACMIVPCTRLTHCMHTLTQMPTSAHSCAGDLHTNHQLQSTGI